jgi:hypothetical protein
VSPNAPRPTRDHRAAIASLLAKFDGHYSPEASRWVETGDGGIPEADAFAELLVAREAAADKAADKRWTAALAHADWDGGVFHHEGRIYPWPRGFVPDCPATWASKTYPLTVRIKELEKALEKAMVPR